MPLPSARLAAKRGIFNQHFMELQEKAMRYVEDHIPEMAGQATQQAYWHTLASGHSVVVAQGGKLWEAFPDGTRRFIKDIDAPTTVEQKRYIIPAV